MLVSSWILVVVALLLASVLQLVIPAFRELYAGFGVDLPAITELFLRFSLVYFLVPLLLLVLAIQITLQREHDPAFRQRMGWISAGDLLLVLAMLAGSAMALYLPIYVMDDRIYIEAKPEQ
ncbi:hypothetical protein [Chitinilyticum piscinae]|uniref:Uncharacterized protein n=1 Tax=Chitinilyticum piscinae TaxID=2866724 RepID=A0A8J7FYL1_9NEIS|nr:hypothetical protein [Chitinilyticum piscinae]MBE9608078.1 hypothetical protein [Chitinilyticum piscinae]